MSEPVRWAIAFIGAFLAGSIPSGLLLGFAKGVDIREHGSGNIGATNAMRVLGRKIGVLCFALDVLKGALPTALLGLWLGVFGEPDPPPAEALLWMGVAVSTVLGHMFCPWIGFRGGKGVATGFGATLGLWPLLTLASAGALIIWIACARITRYVGLSSCIAAASMPLLVISLRAAGVVGDGPDPGARVMSGWTTIIAATLLAALVIWKHRGNLARTIAGTEPRIGATPARSAE